MRQQLFGMPIWQEHINPRTYNKQEITDTITRNFQKDRGRIHPQWQGTSDVHLGGYGYSVASPYVYADAETADAENTEYETPNWDHSLRNLYFGVLQNFFNTINAQSFEFTFEISNYVCYGSSQWIQEHVHSHCDFVAIHYVRFDPMVHTATRFKSPLYYAKCIEEIRCATRPKYNLEDPTNSWMFQTFEPEIVEDDMLIHPALLEHDTRPQKGDDDNLRIAVVLNIEVKNSDR